MVKNIDWQEFKIFRATTHKEQDNFMMLLDFLKSYYKLFNIYDIYETLKNDDTSIMMLQKRDIKDPQDLESYLYKPV